MNSLHLLKFFSLLLAITLWFYVLNSEPLEIERKVGLVLIPPPGLAINTEVPKKINVKVRGSRNFVKNLFFAGEKIFVDLKNYPYRQETFAITFDPSMIPAPFGVEVLEVKPPQIILSLEREIKKKVPVRPKVVGELSKDLRLIRTEIEPNSFMIKGPYSVLKKIGQLETAPIDLSLLEGGEDTLKIPLIHRDPRVVIEDLKEDLLFKYIIRPNKANFTLRNVKIRFLTPHRRFYSPQRWASLDVLMSQEMIQKLNEEQLRSKLKVIAEIPESTRKGKTRIKLEVGELPEGVHLLQIHPKYINVTLR